MVEIFEEKILGYRCPRCKRCAFFLPGGEGDYVDGSEIGSHEVEIGELKGHPVMGDYISCQWCRLKFRSGRLYTKNLGYFGRRDGYERCGSTA